MAQSEHHYRAAAQDMPNGFLGASFGAAGLDQDAVSRIHRIADFRENAELMAKDGGSIAGVMERGTRLARSIQDTKSAASEKAKRSIDNVLFLDLLNDHIDYLEGEADDAREKLAEQFGEDWREQIALEILEPDDIPQRNEDETMVEFRERLEGRLVEEMLDENGEVKPEYRDNPRYTELVRLAETQNDIQKSRELIEVRSDPNSTQAEIDAANDEFLSSPTHQRLLEAQSQALDANVDGADLEAAADDILDDELRNVAVANADAAFLM